MIDARGDQALGHGVVVVVEPLGSETGILFEGVIPAQPFENSFDPRVILIEVGVDEGEETCVGHRSVGAQCDAAVGKFGFTGLAVAGKIDEPTIILWGGDRDLVVWWR